MKREGLAIFSLDQSATCRRCLIPARLPLIKLDDCGLAQMTDLA